MFDKLERKQRLLDELMSHVNSKEADRLKEGMPKGADFTGTGKVMFDQMKPPEMAGVPQSEINKMLDQQSGEPGVEIEIETGSGPAEEESEGKDSMWDGMSGDEIMSLMREYMKG